MIRQRPAAIWSRSFFPLVPMAVAAALLPAAQASADSVQIPLPMGVEVTARLPAGWQAGMQDEGTLVLWTDAPAPRALLVSAPSRMIHDRSFNIGTLEHGAILIRPGEVMGTPASLIAMQMRRIAAAGLSAGEGTLLLAQLHDCLVPVDEDERWELHFISDAEVGAITLGFYSAEGIAGFEPGPAFEEVLAGLTLSLPDRLTPCPAGIADSLQPLPAPILGDGVRHYRLLGQSIALPEGLELVYQGTDDLSFQSFDLLPDTTVTLEVTRDARGIAELRQMWTDEGGPAPDTASATVLPDGRRIAVARIEPSAGQRHPAAVWLAEVEGPEGLVVVLMASEARWREGDWPAILAMQEAALQSLLSGAAPPAPAPVVLGAPGQLIRRDAAADLVPLAADVAPGLALRAALPPGWEALDLSGSLSLMPEIAPRRLLMVDASGFSPVRPDDFAGMIQWRPMQIAGHPARLFYGQAAAGQIGYLSRVTQGVLAIALLEHCLADSYGDPRPIAVVLYSEAVPGLPVEDPVLATLLEGLELVIDPDAPGRQPCPPELFEGIGGFAELTHDGGWTQYRRFGIDLWLPEAAALVANEPDVIRFRQRDEAGFLLEVELRLVPSPTPRQLIEALVPGAVWRDGPDLRLADGLGARRLDFTRTTGPLGPAGPVAGSVLTSLRPVLGTHYLQIRLMYRAEDTPAAALAAEILSRF